MMCCGGPKIPTIYDKEGLMKRLRSIDDLDIDMKLSDFRCQFDQHKAIWNNNFYKVTPLMSTKYDEEITSLKQKLYEKEIKCEELEKLYLAKTVRLLYMAQTHCQLKAENDKLFEKYGIKTGNILPDLDKILPNANNKKINENDDKESEDKKEKENNKELVPV